MNTDIMLDAVGYIDSDLIDGYFKTRAGLAEQKPRKRLWLRLGGIAACLVLMVTLVSIILPIFNGIENPTLPQKPNGDSIIWAENPFIIDPETGDIKINPDYEYFYENGENREFKNLKGLMVSEELYDTLMKNTDGNLGICVDSSSEESFNLKEVLLKFQKVGIYSEIVKDNLYIFPTKEDFLSMNLSDKLKKALCFTLVSKEVYEGLFVMPSLNEKGD